MAPASSLASFSIAFRRVGKGAERAVPGRSDSLRRPRWLRRATQCHRGPAERAPQPTLRTRSPAAKATPSTPALVEGRLHARAVKLERALLADRIRPLEDPIVPSGEPPENLGLHGLGAGEAQVCLHAGQGVGREARPLPQHDPELV